MKNTVEEFLPGMILTINKDKSNQKTRNQYKKLFAPGFSPAIRLQIHSCESCHNNSAALGYGRGKLEYKISGNSSRWLFTLKYSDIKYDGLPEDAWIGFLKKQSYNSTIRNNTRPFTIEEQRKMLTIGACLSCHSSKTQVMKELYLNLSM